MRAVSALALCALSGLMGAGIDHYWTNLVGVIANSKASTSADNKELSDQQGKHANDSEVLGDRTKCTFRFQELKLPTSQWETFFKECMGDGAGGSTNK
jgi:hypothetical protein